MYSEGEIVRHSDHLIEFHSFDRFNLDKSNGWCCEDDVYTVRFTNRVFTEDVYDAELERMNTSMSADNHSLQRDNKQLNALIKEYEQTLETVMNAFRNRAVRLLVYSDRQPNFALTVHSSMRSKSMN